MRISAEIRDSSDPVFSEGIYLSLICPDLSEIIAKNTTMDIKVMLRVPANYSENGI